MLCSRCGKEHSEAGIKLMLRGFHAGDARQIGVRQRTMPGEFDAGCFAAELDEAEQRYQQRLVEVQAAQESKEEDVPWGQRWVVARLRLAGYEVTKPTAEGKQRVRGQYGRIAYVWETNKYVLFRAIVVEGSPAAGELYQTLQPRLGDGIHPARKVLKHKNYHRMDIFLTGPSDYEALAQHLPLLERAAPHTTAGVSGSVPYEP